MKRLANAVKDYCQYLNSLHLKVSVHYSKRTIASIPTELFEILKGFNSHSNPYCIYVKKTRQPLCVNSQHCLISACRSSEPFWHSCHAGVSEYIQPFFKGAEALGIIAVSGYRGSGEIVSKELWSTALSEQPEDTEALNTLIYPLKVMLEKLLGDLEYQTNEYNLILQYLNEYYITADLYSICLHFHRSPSHISHLFKKNSGVTVRRYCNSLKLKHAEKLLVTTDMTVTQIALEVGFNDVSHFISLFGEMYGTSPLAYRKNR